MIGIFEATRKFLPPDNLCYSDHVADIGDSFDSTVEMRKGELTMDTGTIRSPPPS